VIGGTIVRGDCLEKNSWEVILDFERRNQNDALIGGALSLVLDSLIALVVMNLTDNQWESFWCTLAVLFSVYLLIGLKRLIWSTIVWRLWARRREVDRITAVLRASGLPPLDYGDSDPESYFAHTKANPALPCDVRIHAAECGIALNLLASSHGLLTSLRVHRAWDEAFANSGRPFKS
jgi:hypothetical protein